MEGEKHRTPCKTTSPVKGNEMVVKLSRKHCKNIIDTLHDQTCSDGDLDHALSNALILENVFAYLDHITIRRVRQVCKKWKEESSKNWFANAILVVRQENKEGAAVTISQMEAAEGWQNESSTNLPYWKNFVKFKFDECAISLESPMWDSIGPTVEYLYFDKCKFIGDEPGRVITQIVFEKTPKLQMLVLNRSKPISSMQVLIQSDDLKKIDVLEEQARVRPHEHLQTVHVQGGIPLYLFILLPLAPELKELRLGNYGTAKYSFREFFQPFFDLIAVSPNYQLKSLKFLDLMDTHVYDNFTNRGTPDIVPLKRIAPSLEIMGAKVSSLTGGPVDFQTRFLQTYKNNLTVLKLTNIPPDLSTMNGLEFNLELKVLRELHVWGVGLQDFNFLALMPKLKILKLHSFCYEIQDHQSIRRQLQPLLEDLPFIHFKVSRMVAQSEMYDTMASLEELETDFKFSADDFSTLSRWMPNLKSLKTVVNTASFRAVCEVWPRLERLTLAYGSEINDESITGITATKKRSKDRASSPSLKDLHDLKAFQLYTRCNKGKLTDVSVRNGFLKMPYLHLLKICVAPQMSTQAEKLLKTSTQSQCHVEIYRNYGHDAGETDQECCKRHAYHKKYFPEY